MSKVFSTLNWVAKPKDSLLDEEEVFDPFELDGSERPKSSYQNWTPTWDEIVPEEIREEVPPPPPPKPKSKSEIMREKLLKQMGRWS